MRLLRRLRAMWGVLTIFPSADVADWDVKSDSEQMRRFLTGTSAGQKYVVLLRNSVVESGQQTATAKTSDQAMFLSGVVAGKLAMSALLDELSGANQEEETGEKPGQGIDFGMLG